MRNTSNSQIRPIASSRRPSHEFTMNITVSAEGCAINWYSSDERSISDEIRERLDEGMKTTHAAPTLSR